MPRRKTLPETASMFAEVPVCQNCDAGRTAGSFADERAWLWDSNAWATTGNGTSILILHHGDARGHELRAEELCVGCALSELADPPDGTDLDAMRRKALTNAIPTWLQGYGDDVESAETFLNETLDEIRREQAEVEGGRPRAQSG